MKACRLSSEPQNVQVGCAPHPVTSGLWEAWMLVPVPMSVKSLLSSAMYWALLWIHNRVLVLNLRNLTFLCRDKVVQHADLYVKMFDCHRPSIRESYTLLFPSVVWDKFQQLEGSYHTFFFFFICAFFFYQGTTVMTLLLNKTRLYFYRTSYTYIF